MHRTGKQQTEMLKLLTKDNKYALDFTEVDTLEWTAFERASSYGTAEDVQTLLKLGADPLGCRAPLGWSSIFYAVDGGNWSTFNALLPSHGGITRTLVDERGWSLLHIAASNGHEQMIRYLLENGCDPGLRCKPSRLYVNETLHDRTCTPGEVAEAHGEETYTMFVSIMQDMNIESDWDDYWDAEE
jgi:ankyrin repeat protein